LIIQTKNIHFEYPMISNNALFILTLSSTSNGCIEIKNLGSTFYLKGLPFQQEPEMNYEYSKLIDSFCYFLSNDDHVFKVCKTFKIFFFARIVIMFSGKRHGVNLPTCNSRLKQNLFYYLSTRFHLFNCQGFQNINYAFKSSAKNPK